MYTIKEIYKTIQGEGAQAGRTAIFVRFAGCNLWSGKEKHRESAVCKFCDTDFVGTNGVNGGTYSAKDLLLKLNELWAELESKLIVFTGGEPMLQLDRQLIQECKNNDFETAIETNGTIPIDFDIDWVCISPKHGSKLVVKHGNELKVVFPQEGQDLDHFWIWSLIICIFSPWMALKAKKIQGRPFSIAWRTLGGNLAFSNTN